MFKIKIFLLLAMGLLMLITSSNSLAQGMGGGMTGGGMGRGMSRGTGLGIGSMATALEPDETVASLRAAG